MMWGYGHNWGMMDVWGGGAFNMIIWPLVLAALVIGVIWLVRSPSHGSAGRQPRRSSGIDILEERYARGELIATSSYKRRKKFLVEAAFRWNSHRCKQGDQTCRSERFLPSSLSVLSRLRS